MLKIISEKVPHYGNRLSVSDESRDEYRWAINHLKDDLRETGYGIYGLNDSKKNRTYLEQLFNAHGIQVEFIN